MEGRVTYYFFYVHHQFILDSESSCSTFNSNNANIIIYFRILLKIKTPTVITHNSRLSGLRFW